MRSPAVYAKLTSEIDAAVADGTLSIPVSHADAIKLPYLKACINEGMRIHPSVGLTLPRIVPAGGALISGFHFPAGYQVGINAAVVQYDEDVFGPDADEFNPDRWNEGDAVKMNRTMIQFGAGPRTCIGKNVSAYRLDSGFLSSLYLFANLTFIRTYHPLTFPHTDLSKRDPQVSPSDHQALQHSSCGAR